MKLDFLFETESLLGLGAGFFMLASMTLSFISGKDPYPQTVILIGIVQIILAAGASMYIANFSQWGAEWVELKYLSKEVYEQFKQTSTVFLYVFPFVTAAIGTNLLTGVITRNFTYNKELTFRAVISGIWEAIKLMLGCIQLFVVLIVIYPILVVCLFNTVLDRYSPIILARTKRVNRRAHLILLKVDIIQRHYIRLIKMS